MKQTIIIFKILKQLDEKGLYNTLTRWNDSTTDFLETDVKAKGTAQSTSDWEETIALCKTLNNCLAFSTL